MAGRAIGVYAPGVGGYALGRGEGAYGEAVGADAAGDSRPRVHGLLDGVRTRVCQLGFSAAPQLRGPAGLGFAAPQLRGPAAERPRRFRAHGGRDCVQGMPFRVLRGPAAAQPRR